MAMAKRFLGIGIECGVVLEISRGSFGDGKDYISIYIQKPDLDENREVECFEAKIWNGKRDELVIPEIGDEVLLEYNPRTKKNLKDGKMYFNTSCSIWRITVTKPVGGGGDSESAEDREIRLEEEKVARLRAERDKKRNGSTAPSSKATSAPKPAPKIEAPMEVNTEEVPF